MSLKRRPHTEGLPSLNGAMLLEYRRFQKVSKSLGAPRSVREKPVKESNSGKKEVASSFGEPCAFHGKTLDFYCHTHKEPACIICATTMHKVCNVVTVSENAVKSQHACFNLSDIEQTIEVVLDNIEKIRVDREDNLTKLLLQRHSIEKELHSARKKLNEKLDRIEKEVISLLNDNFRRYKSEIDTLTKDFEYRKDCLKSLQSSLSKAKHMDTDVEAFLEGKRIEKKVHHEEKHISSFYNDESIKQIDFEFKLNPLINSFIADVKAFGDLTVRKSPSRVNLTRILHKVHAPEIAGYHLNRHVSHIKIRLKEKTYNATGIKDIKTLPHIQGLNRQKTM